MIKELKFVQGAVSSKGFTPELSHFKIKEGVVQSYNGSLALSTPIAFDIDCIPKAAPFVKAISNCDETVTMSMTPAGRLAIKSGKFRAYIECLDPGTALAHVEPTGDAFEINGEGLLTALKTIVPFIGNDASRPWTNGVLLAGNSAFATNNVTVVEYWIGTEFPLKCNVPKEAIREMLRINEAPISAQADESSISFHYADKRWVRCQLLATDWPDINAIVSKECNASEINPELFNAINVVKPFVDDAGRIYFNEDVIRTSVIDSEGATHEVEGIPDEGVYNYEMLNLLKNTATHVDFSLYPKPCIFYGTNLRGAIVGMRT